MATIHVSGTKLARQQPRLPLIKPFLVSFGFVFIVAMHFFMPNPGGSGLALSFNPTTWLAVAFSLAIGFYQIGTEGRLRYNKLTIGFFICCILITLPVLYPNASLALSIGKLTGLWAGFTLFTVLQQFRFSNKQKQRLLWFIVIGVAVEALFGWIQYLWLEPGNPFGYNTVSNRPYGIFQQPNVMASFLATGLAVSGYLLTRQPIKYQSKISDVALLYIMPALTMPLLVLLASRTGWISTTLVILLILPYLYRFATKKRFIGWLLSTLLGLFLAVLPSLITAQETSSTSTIEHKFQLQDVRGDFFPQALDMLIEKPFTGYGYGRFEPEYIVYTARQHQLNVNYPAGLPTLDHPHNELLYWGVEGGLVPVLAIFLAAILVLVRIYHGKKGSRLALFALFIPIVLHSQLEYPFYHSAIHWITFIVLLYWVDQRANTYKNLSLSLVSNTALRVMSLVVPILTSFYMLSTLQTNYVLTQFEKSNPKDPDILNQVTNPIVWQDRYDWDIYSTYLNIGLYKHDPEFIQPYIDWSLKIIKDKPRPAFYNNLILAYQGLEQDEKAEQIRSEAQFLFPNKDFSEVRYIPPNIDALTAKPAE
ncbi:PglL family O-oligosaccharyltransferase [Vibrio atypicus]|uniref:PglL family O-oligosaccharyltransferase n=1 Tax=Vibrio atypicus TaxID=558271 RepID=UPI001356A89A|nr:PglL family O-oligosaccharyltransferase [Vibrio atypicus]